MVRPWSAPSGWWTVAYPALWLRLQYFRSLVRDHVYLPLVVTGEPTGAADRVGLIGSRDAPRVGVNLNELTTLGRTAAAVSSARRRAFVWVFPGGDGLTAAEVVAKPMVALDRVDAVVLVLGFSDVLLMTTQTVWERRLEDVVRAVRDHAGEACGIIVAGLAPMNEFRYTARLGRKRIRRQVVRLAPRNGCAPACRGARSSPPHRLSGPIPDPGTSSTPGRRCT